MTPGNPIKMKAEKLITFINQQVSHTLEAFIVRFPEIETMMRNKTEHDWVYSMTVGGTVASIMINRQLTGEESTEIVQALSNWNSNAKASLEDLLGFIDTGSKSGMDHFSALGLWVTRQIKDDPPSSDDTGLAEVIGVFLRDSFNDSWGSV